MNTQWLWESVSDASTYLIIAIGFGIIYRTTHFFDFSFAALISATPYAALSFQSLWGLSLLPALCAAYCVTIIIALLLEVVLFSQFRRRTAAKSTLLLASLGTWLAIRNGISSIWGDQAVPLLQTEAVPGYSTFIGTVTPLQIYTLLAAAIFAVCLGLLLHLTVWGRLVRAVGDDAGLSVIFGIRELLIVSSVYAVGAVGAGTAGLFLALDVGATPNLGFRPFLFAVIAVIIAGKFSLPKLLFASAFLAFIQHLVIWEIDSRWQEVVIFGVCLFFLVSKSMRNDLALPIPNQ